ncbi:hypothetical protein [Natranaerofaba carboxydovora]|uniref:hypothetical protein n=1 Tax=Natranaerofaba carboxydovora TaxID=2742683 RepID=UPI001F146A48|nr:hypothetical protein [Natranaerofaba carboxydovora]UMZ74270.1 TIGR00276: epoxyqueuosine reductase [Natranaerofaba carboxydovora]
MKDIIENEIKRFLSENEENKFFADTPLVGYADVKDPLFTKYKEIIGDFHLTPEEFFRTSYPGEDLTEGTVISWILPIKESVRDTNRTQDLMPSKEWAHGRNFGEQFNKSLREHMQEFLRDKGYKTISPMLSEKWERIKSDSVGYASSWSERHGAYACGLGTFGLSDGFITEKGIAHRCGSVVTELKLEPNTRGYESPYENCLFHSQDKCGACMKKCPAGAITKDGHDKDICHDYIREQVMAAVNEKYGVKMPGCGLCQVGVPCEKKAPVH